jgi:predicted nucleotidyltransferase
MLTKKSTTKTATSKPKYYIVLDSDMDIVCQGNWDEVKEALEEIMDDSNDSENREMLSDFTLYELSAGKKLKFIPAIPATVEL